MTKYILKRLGQGLLTVFLTVSTVFVLVRLAPGDPAVAYAGPLATTEELAKVREQFGLDLPLIQQYWIFLQQLFTGDLGTSYSFQAPAIQVVLERMPYTLTLATASILLTAVVAIPLGVWMSRRAGHQTRIRRQRPDHRRAVHAGLLDRHHAADLLRSPDPDLPGLRLRHLGRPGPADRHHRHPADRPDLADGPA